MLMNILIMEICLKICDKWNVNCFLKRKIEFARQDPNPLTKLYHQTAETEQYSTPISQETWNAIFGNKIVNISKIVFFALVGWSYVIFFTMLVRSIFHPPFPPQPVLRPPQLVGESNSKLLRKKLLNFCFLHPHWNELMMSSDMGTVHHEHRYGPEIPHGSIGVTRNLWNPSELTGLMRIMDIDYYSDSLL